MSRLANFPLIYSCSGCSSAAQMANEIARQLDRRDIGEWSCIAGVGGDVPSLVNRAVSGRPIIAIDGCPLQCVKACLARHDVQPTRHYLLHEHGVKKKQHAEFDPAHARELADYIADETVAAEVRVA
ncbi:MAG TPA: putative zinc-binding protein [Burkholderiales bacterium]